MNNVLLCVLAAALCLLAGAALSRMLTRRRDTRRWQRALLTAVFTILFAVMGCLAYFEVYYHADPSVSASLQSGGAVQVSQTDTGWLFDGPGTDSAVIFYPGGKVEATAYAPLLNRLANEGVDTFLVEMPLRFAFLGKDRARTVMKTQSYQHWYLMGHSLGGCVAAGCASEPEGGFTGLILLASYPIQAIPDSVRLLSVCGSQDQCLNARSYEKGRSFWPEDAVELVLPGGNHAQFGSYGPQKGDGAAGISAEEQQRLTAGAILSWMDASYSNPQNDLHLLPAPAAGGV